MSVRRLVFGSLNEGENARVVHKYDISNQSGSLKVSVTEYGATLLSVQTWDRHGELEQITLNYYDDLNALANQEGKPYLGCIAGRYANRIAKGRFSLDGEEFQLAVNNGANHLHGGVKGFDTKVWESDIIDEASTGRVGVRFSLLSPDLDEGYPGAVQVVVEYEVKGEDLLVHIYATTTKPTVLNLTNHAYWNLSGDGKRTIHDHLLHLACHHYLPVDETQIPLGEIAIVNGNSDPEENVYDFCTENVPKRLGERLHRIDGGGQPGLDHCFVVDGYQSEQAAGEAKPLLDVATLIDPLSGRVMVVRSTQPGVQVYTANWLPPYTAKDVEDASADTEVHAESELAARRARLFQQHNAICLETQHFPDSPNQSQFTSTIVRPAVPSETPRTPTATDNDFHELTVFQFRVLTPSASSSQDSQDEQTDA